MQMTGSLLNMGQAGSEGFPAQIAIIIAVVLLIIWILILRFGWLYIQAAVSGAYVPFLSLIAMRLRRASPREVVQAYIASVKGEADITLEQIETHVLAGGNIGKVVAAVVAARRAGVDMTYDEACAHDLSGRDILEVVRERILAHGVNVDTSSVNKA